jgi:hypothetical protein
MEVSDQLHPPAAVSAPDPILTSRRKDKSLALIGNRTPTTWLFSSQPTRYTDWAIWRKEGIWGKMTDIFDSFGVQEREIYENEKTQRWSEERTKTDQYRPQWSFVFCLWLPLCFALQKQQPLLKNTQRFQINEYSEYWKNLTFLI